MFTNGALHKSIMRQANQALQRTRFARLLNGRTVSCVDEASHDLAQQKQILNCVVMTAICV